MEIGASFVQKHDQNTTKTRPCYVKQKTIALKLSRCATPLRAYFFFFFFRLSFTSNDRFRPRPWHYATFIYAFINFKRNNTWCMWFRKPGKITVNLFAIKLITKNANHVILIWYCGLHEVNGRIRIHVRLTTFFLFLFFFFIVCSGDLFRLSCETWMY